MNPEEVTTTGKNGNASKLINAAIWIFIVSAFSIVTSVFYVLGLSAGLNFEFRIYFGIKDYLEVTPYWLGQPLRVAFAAMIIFYGFKYLKSKEVFRLKPEPGQKWLPWLYHKLTVGHLIPAVYLIALAVLIVLALFLFCLLAPTLALAGLWVLGATLGIYWLLNSKITEGFGGSLVSQIRSQPFLWQLGTLALTVVSYAFLLGSWLEPVVFRNYPLSTIYLASSNSEARVRVLFSLTQYLLASYARRRNSCCNTRCKD